MISFEWTNIFLYAEILDDSSEVFFYFNTPKSEDYIHFQNTPEHFHVNEGLLFDLHNVFKFPFKQAAPNKRMLPVKSLYIV